MNITFVLKIFCNKGHEYNLSPLTNKPSRLTNTSVSSITFDCLNPENNTGVIKGDVQSCAYIFINNINNTNR